MANVLWKYDLAGLTTDTPIYCEGACYIECSGGFLYAIDLKSGKLRWKYDTHGPAAPTHKLDKTLVYTINARGQFHALDRISGEVIWHYQTPMALLPSMHFLSDTVYLTGLDGTIHALASWQPEAILRWAWRSPARSISSLQVYQHNGPAALCSSLDGRLYALDLGAQKLRWQQDLSSPACGLPETLHHDNLALVPTQDGVLHAIDFYTGESKWKTRLDGPLISAPVVQHGRVYLGSARGSFYVIRPDDGKILHSHRTTGRILTSPLWSAGHECVYVADAQGFLYTFSIAGKLLKSEKVCTGIRSPLSEEDGCLAICSSEGELLFVRVRRKAQAQTTTKTTKKKAVKKKAVKKKKAKLKPKKKKVAAGTLTQSTRAKQAKPFASSASSLYMMGRHCLNRRAEFDGEGFTKLREVAWKTKFSNGFFGSPVIVGELLYIGDTSGTFYAIDTNKGQTRWKKKLGSAIWGAAAVADDIVFIGDYANDITALDRFSGDEIWSYRTKGSIFASPAASGGRVYCPDMNGNLYALCVRTGTLAWSRAIGGSMFPSPAVHGEELFIGNNSGNKSKLVAMNYETGEILWEAKTKAQEYASPSADRTQVYYGSVDGLYAYDKKGNRLWHYKTKSRVDCGAAAADDLVYFGTSDGEFIAVHRETGKRAWTHKTKEHIYGAPAIAGDMVYFGSNDKKLYAFDRHKGTVLWDFKTKDRVWSSPSVAEHGSVIYCANDGGQIYKLLTKPA